ncbi:MAG: hypothetical protein KatS3mg031_1445 [Chitinophagales bacterium]|nr:MAG: hypothetical protein KatS3mg031_1445 [Chitinophagales bacterium]
MKSFSDIKTIAVAGAGAMGSGIARQCALAGYPTLLYDISEEALSRAWIQINHILDQAVEKQKITAEQKEKALQKLAITQDIHALTTDVVIEAVAEKLEVKQELFRQLASQNDPACIFATNTSSIPITRIASAVPHPERVVGLHFFNPVHIMKLVEIVSGAFTHPVVTEAIRQLALELGKTPVLAKDSPGFIVNRVARPYYVEALRTLEENCAPHDTIDVLMEATGFKLGPFRLMDLVGNDINYAVTASLYASFHYEPRFRPSRIQQQKVESGHLGQKTGKGFYDYTAVHKPNT